MHDRLQTGTLTASEGGDRHLEEAASAATTIPYRANLLGNIEQALKGLQGYGIMALELIQNADDAGAPNLSFDARDDALVVGNDGSFTSCGLRDAECPWLRSGDPTGLRRPCNFHAIAEMGSRSKLHAAEQIGRFGIGFVSVYQITDTPIIRSSGVEVRLNPQTQEVVKRAVDVTSGTEFVLPWASVQSDVREGLNASPTPADVADKVVAEIEVVLQGSLLFLRHVERVELRRNGALVTTVEIERSGEDVTLRFTPSGEVQRWLVIAREADDVLAGGGLFERFEALARLERSRTVNVAVPVNLQQVEGLLYAYLPTRQSTRMPIHVNADFFPHASRQAIVLEGEQHERYWNEALIATAAAGLAENFVRVRDLLGPTRFWALAEAAFLRKAEPAFKAFWERLGSAAAGTQSVWTTKGEWRLPRETTLPPESMATVDQAALADLGLPLIHAELRRHWTVLSSIGAQQLRLSGVVGALEALGADATLGGGERLRRLWSATELLINATPDRVSLPAVLNRLKAVPFMLDLAGQPTSPKDARRLPYGVSAEGLRRFVPTRRVLGPEVMSRPALSSLVGEYLLDDLAADLSASIGDEAAALAVIGGTEADVRRLYTLLTSFPNDRGVSSVGARLADVPILRTGSGFVSPSRGQLPGDFRDPIGHFQIIETRLFVTGMEALARNVLQVNVLSFRNYVADHLEEIVRIGVSRQQYGALLTEIVNHRFQLDEDGTLDTLSSIAFIRTRAGGYARPADVYVWSAPLASILGDGLEKWVDESWLPSAIRPRALDVFERLGMPFTVAAEHIVDRIVEIAGSGGIDAIVAGTTPIIRHVLDRWTSFDEKDRVALGRLAQVHFLSALVDGERNQGSKYMPRGMYRAGRAAGFSSQVPIVEMPALRQANAVVTEFLDLIGLPAEPPTEKVVAHLEHCMASGNAVNDLTYQMLSERLERSDDVAAIDRLSGTDFIYVPDVGFIGAGEVFWIPPALGGRWHSASPRMRQREPLYRRLGVVDAPEPRHYAALALQIAGDAERSGADPFIHSRCIAHLAEALEREADGAAEAVDLLAGADAFLDLNGDPTWTGEAIWLDSEQLASSFGSVLDERLVRLDEVSRSAASRFMHRLDIPALSDVARFSLAEEPDGRPADEPAALLHSRADLILWLAPNRASREALHGILRHLELRFSDRLLVHAEIDAFDPPVRSPAISAPAYLDTMAGLLHVRSERDRLDWVAAFRVIFAEIERFCPTADIPPLCLTAAYIMSLEDRDEAEQALRASDFKAPADVDPTFEAGRELEDDPEDDGGIDPDPGLDGSDDREAAGSEAADQDGIDENGIVFDADASDTMSGVDRRPWSARSGAENAAGEQSGSGSADADLGDGPGATGAGGRSGVGEDHEFGGSGSEDLDAADDDYGSAASRGGFGADDAEPSTAAPDGGGAGTAARPGGGLPRTSSAAFRTGGGRTNETMAERQVRRSRMLSYVARSASRREGDAPAASDAEDISALIDAAAMKAALSYERTRGWEPAQQPHFNPGFDILSKSPAGKQRLIEVKGLESEWTERGIKLSHVQFSMAREHPDDFWIYVVEHARDVERQRVTAIGNPFGKVEEYWFDHNWREASEERVASRDIHLAVGLKVEHPLWGKGTVVEIKSRGAIPFVVVDFGSIEGRRGVPFNSSLRIVG